MIQGKFRANDMNVVDIHKEIDMRVALEEVKFSIDRILEDLQAIPGYSYDELRV